MEQLSILWLSIKVAGFASLLVMVTATLIAQCSIEQRSVLFKIVEFLTYLPMAMPPVALGYALLLIFGPRSGLGRFLHDLGIDIAFSFLGAVLAAFFASLGIGVRTMKVALSSVDLAQKQVAVLQGAKPWQIFWWIVLPQCHKALLGGTILVFIRALGEFGATMVLVGTAINGERTLAMAIWVGMQMPNKENDCLFLVLISVMLSLLTVLGAEILLRKAEK